MNRTFFHSLRRPRLAAHPASLGVTGWLDLDSVLVGSPPTTAPKLAESSGDRDRTASAAGPRRFLLLDSHGRYEAGIETKLTRFVFEHGASLLDFELIRAGFWYSCYLHLEAEAFDMVRLIRSARASPLFTRRLPEFVATDEEMITKPARADRYWFSAEAPSVPGQLMRVVKVFERHGWWVGQSSATQYTRQPGDGRWFGLLGWVEARGKGCETEIADDLAQLRCQFGIEFDGPHALAEQRHRPLRRGPRTRNVVLRRGRPERHRRHLRPHDPVKRNWPRWRRWL